MKHAPYPFAAKILSMPRPLKRVVAIIVDCSLCVLTVWLAYYLRLGEFVYLSDGGLVECAVSIVIAVPVFIVFGLYRAIFRYSGFRPWWPSPGRFALRADVCLDLHHDRDCGCSAHGRHHSAAAFALVCQPVASGRAPLARRSVSGHAPKRFAAKVLIYGAGGTGRQLAAALANSHEMKVVGFLDDDDGFTAMFSTVCRFMRRKI